MLKQVAIDEIRVGDRHRLDLGDLASLAASIRDRGLLHPPVVTSSMDLVCGFRRIKAAESLGWSKIDVRLIDPDDMLLAERDENEVRKDFTPSERVSIGKTIEARVNERRGRPAYRAASADQEPQQIVEDIPQLPPGKKTREIAAEAAGFDNSMTYRQAAKVVKKGAPELVDAMDSGKVSIAAAAEVASLPVQAQVALVAEGPKAVKVAAKVIRDDRKASPKPAKPRPKPLLNLGQGPAFPLNGEPRSTAGWAIQTNKLNDVILFVDNQGGVADSVHGWTQGQVSSLANHLARFQGRLEGWLDHLRSEH